jgi:hypothetical protein
MDLSDRIAVCFSGQIRTGVYTSTNILRYIGDLLPKTDFFIHTWDTETISPWALNGRDKKIVNVPFNISSDKFNKMIDIYCPISARVDNFNEYIQDRRKVVKNYIYRSGLFHSAYESIKLKKEYERLNNSVYYKILRLRPDMLFGKYGQLAYEIEYTMQKYTSKTEYNENKLYVNDPWNGGPELIEDVCWLSSSPIMDVTCDVIHEFEDNTKIFANPWQHQHKLFLDRNGVISRSFKHNSIRIYRDYMVGTDMDIS